MNTYVEVEKHIIQEKINQEIKRIEVPPLKFIDKAVDISVVAQRQAHMNQMVQKTIEISQLQHTDQVVDVPVVVVAQVPQGARCDADSRDPGCRSWRRQLRSHSCRSSRKS